MLERDMFQARMKDGKPIYVHEFMYPVMQAYDSVVMDVDGEVGGNDQTFNMLAGRDLMKIMKNKEKFVLTMKLLTDASGKKMGKTEGNMVALSDSAEDMFGKVMSWSDDMIMRGFELCTKIPAEDMGKIEKDLKSGGNPRDMKLRLAHGVVATFLGVKDAKKAEENFISQFSKKEMPKDIKEWMPELKKMRPIDILVQSGLCKSRGEARAVVRGRGMSINGVDIVNEVDAVELKNNDIIKKGSRGLKKVKF
jgi:tyrosyl-tRNA synthetase